MAYLSNSKPVQQHVKLSKDGTHVEVEIEFELNIDVKIDGESITTTTMIAPTPESTPEISTTVPQTITFPTAPTALTTTTRGLPPTPSTPSLIEM